MHRSCTGVSADFERLPDSRRKALGLCFPQAFVPRTRTGAQGKALGGAETEGLTPGVWKALEIKRDSRARPVQSATFITETDR